MPSGFERERKVVVFDLDNTLIDVGPYHGLGRRRAIQEVYGIEEKLRRGALTGNTMANVLRIICRDSGVPDDVIEAGLQDALRVWARTSAEVLPLDLRTAVLPGVLRLLSELRERGHALVLVTGSLTDIGHMLLERSGLGAFFCAFAFGDEGRDRPALLRLALERAQAAFGSMPAPEDVVVVRDSPRDVESAQAVGARAVAVATGSHTVEALAPCKADAVLADFRDPKAALAAILDKRGTEL